MNSGGNKIVAELLLLNNKVYTQASDTTYQCFGTCELTQGSGNNRYCGGKFSSEFDSGKFTKNNCGTATEEELHKNQIRDKYPASKMPT